MIPRHRGARRLAQRLALVLVATGLTMPATARQTRTLPKAAPPRGITTPDGRPIGPYDRALLPPPTTAPVEPLGSGDGKLLRRATGRAFGEALRIDVRAADQGAADAALRAAVAEIREMEALSDPAADPHGNGLAALDAAAGGTPVALDPRLLDLLARAQRFCTWSQGAQGPLGGRLDAAWGLGGPGPRARPTPGALAAAVTAADCAGLRLDTEGGHAQLAAGQQAALRGFATGFAVDRAIAVLRDHQISDAFVEVGWVRRAFGSAEGGDGWPLLLPVFPGLTRPLERVWLHDESLAVTSAVHDPLVVAGDRYAPWIDQRNGRPIEGVEGVVAVAELAVDAQALATSLFVLGNREGMLRAGVLEPRPSVTWLLGDGSGPPILTYFNWSPVATD